MKSAAHQATGRTTIPSPPRSLRVALICVEYGLAGILAFLMAQFAFQLMATDPPADRPLQTLPVSNSETNLDAGILTGFDPFFRELGGTEVVVNTAVRESSLRLEVFGLRSEPGGEGTAIIKAQDGEQKLIRIGDRIAPGVTLAAVYPDRLEVNRAGIREAIYLRPQRERQTPVAQAPARPVAIARESESDLTFDLSALNLEPVRRERRIIGFRLPDPLPLPLMGSGLEAGDILTHANGEPLVSFERLQEIGEGLSVAQRLAIEVERRGERRNLTISLGGTQ